MSEVVAGSPLKPFAFRQNPNLLRLGANVDLRLDAIGRHFKREIERVDALLELTPRKRRR